jgi:radical SAM protein with 4Fe4S-binding SPASM domain
MDVFDYAEHFIMKLARAYPPTRPLQVELHPGLHCDLYRCPFCYGHGQAPLAGKLITRGDVARILDDLEGIDPLIHMAGVTTEPLTHPAAAEIVTEIRRRGFRFALHTKGYRLDDRCAHALLEGTSECFVTISMDAVTNDQYMRLHNIPSEHRDGHRGLRGRDYYDIVKKNVRRLHALKLASGSSLQVRIAMLLFEENCDEEQLARAVSEYSDFCDLIRFAVPQVRNDGVRPTNVPAEAESLLQRLAARFAGSPKVRVLERTAATLRDTDFNRCEAQRFQVVIDRCGNVFPCPQVAVEQYAWLCYGNVKATPLRVILNSAARLERFDWDVTTQMRCRVCDRKDEAINVMLDRLRRAFDAVSPHHTPR